MLQRLELPVEVDGSVWRYAGLASANRRHRHVELELNVVTQGRGTYLLGNRRYAIARGDLLWLFPAQEHVLVEQSPDFGMWIAVFRRRALKRHAVDSQARPLLQRSYSGEACRRLRGQDLAHVEQLLSELAASAGEVGLLNAGLSYALLRAWHCFQSASEVPTQALHPAVERAARLIRDQEADGNLQSLAHQAGLSPSRLSRLFKEQTGSTLVDFRNRQKLERFQQIYTKRRDLSLLDAALEAGFGSYPQFHRVFRQMMGASPRSLLGRRDSSAA